MRSFIIRQPKLVLGVKIALAVVATGKAHGATLASGTVPGVPNMATLLPQGVVRKMFNSSDATEPSQVRSSKSQTGQSSALETLGYEPMTYEQARLWLQAYNAGPYATLKYKGNVPYRETRNYVPRVMKYYGEKLDNTQYEKYIVASARKYGLDPQLIRAVMKAESDFNSRTVSHAGARGLMQVMPVVWSHVKKKYNIEWSYSSGVFDPEKNIEVACAYLAWLRYDFLPRHFADFEPNPEAPKTVVRDRGVPPRTKPRIEVKAPEIGAAKAYKEAVETARVLATGSPEEKAALVAANIVEKYGVRPAVKFSDIVATKAEELREEAAKIRLQELVSAFESHNKKRNQRVQVRKKNSGSRRSS